MLFLKKQVFKKGWKCTNRGTTIQYKRLQISGILIEFFIEYVQKENMTYVGRISLNVKKTFDVSAHTCTEENANL